MLRKNGLPNLSMFAFGALICVLAGCNGLEPEERSQRDQVAEDWHLQKMILLDRPPVIAVEPGADYALARQNAQRADPEVLARRDQASRVPIDTLPYLIGSEPGRAFLQAETPRAIARGAPALSCPAAAVVTSEIPVPRSTLAEQALKACVADLPIDRPSCGCEVIAIDNLVTVPRASLAYATGSSARLSIPEQRIDSLLVAEEDSAGRLLLRDLTGPVARVIPGKGEEVTVRFSAGKTYEGRRIQVGFRRGRVAERIYAESADGERLSLLIGFEPDELADQAGAWLAWPSGS
ncbi:MAG: hypothetical protein AAGE80_11550 [Pseudomonadota bacterium]